jgi:hypothetical protein
MTTIYTNPKQLIELLDQQCTLPQADLTLLLKNIYDPKHFKSLLLNIMSEPELLKKIQDSSYKHDNGFAKIILLQGKHFKLRYHLFNVVDDVPMENVHNHRWCFASVVLKGNLKTHLFAPNNNEGEPVMLYKYISNKIQNKYETKFIKKTFLKKTMEHEYAQGSSYLMDTITLHRIVLAPNTTTHTLILTGKPQDLECELYARKTIQEDNKILKYYTKDQINQYLNQLINL